MKGRLANLALCAVIGGSILGCRGPKRAPAGTQTAPSGSLVFAFSRKVRGPVDLTLDGVRIPVEALKKGKRATRLVVTGLAAGKHRFFLSSPRDAFGPDQGEFELPAGKGLTLPTYSQAFDAVLYGSSEALPPAAGLPGVKAHLEP
jgi:hypothetical protein